MRIFATLRAVLTGLAFVAFSAAAHAGEKETFIKGGYGLSGYDAVSYFSDSGPVRGDDAYTHEYDGVPYRFASAENRDAFAADPAKYAPAYGGFCAFGAAMGYKVPVDPQAYRVVDGTLYLNFNKGVQKRWEKDIPGYIRGADHNWPLIAGASKQELDAGKVKGLTVGPH